MAEAAPTTNGGGDGGIGAILTAGDRDFVVRNSGEQVRPSPVLGLLLSPLLPRASRLIVAQICDLALFLPTDSRFLVVSSCDLLDPMMGVGFCGR
jgi:hypothetical protein